MQVDRDDLGDAADDRVTAGEAAAVPGAIADRDDPFRVGRRVIGALQRLAHVLRHRSGHQQHIGMARRGDEAEAKALDIVIGVVERVDLELAAVAGAGVDLADRRLAAEPPPRGAPERGCEFRQRGVVSRWRRLGERAAETGFRRAACASRDFLTDRGPNRSS